MTKHFIVLFLGS